MTLHYTIDELRPYISWTYFYHAWQLQRHDSQQQLRSEAEQWLQRHAGRYSTHALLLLGPAGARGDDILFGGEAAPAGIDPRAFEQGRTAVIPTLRQQQPDSRHHCCLALADFIRPVDYMHDSGCPCPACRRPLLRDVMGLFATTVDMGMETDFADDPYERLMAQLMADRLAEATAELLHRQVRRQLWGYAPDEQLTPDDMLRERWQGIRPAVGYPSLPDTSINFVIDSLLHMADIGIRLTESGAMKPHASVSGLMISHPQARYFAVGKIGADQLTDYARRRGLPVETVRRFIAPLIY